MAGTSDLDRQIEQLRRCVYIKEAEVKALCAKAREILLEESNVQRVDAPVTVCRTAKSRSASGSLRRAGHDPLFCAAHPLTRRVARLGGRSAATSTGSSTT